MNSEDRSVSRRAFLRGAAGAAAVGGASGTAAAAEGGGSGGGGGEGGGGGGGGTQTVEVGPGGNFVFKPGTEEPLAIAPGTKVEFAWKSDNHNIVVETQPDGANWGGHETIENTGFTYSHTFETLGDYHYFCEPHKSAGMVGDITVTENPTQEQGYKTIIPDAAKTLGVATTGAMAAVLGLAYFFMKYGGDYGE